MSSILWFLNNDLLKLDDLQSLIALPEVISSTFAPLTLAGKVTN